MEKKNKKSFLEKMRNFFTKKEGKKNVEPKFEVEAFVSGYPCFFPGSEVRLLKSYEHESYFLSKGALVIILDSGFSRKGAGQKGEGLPGEEWTQVEVAVEEGHFFYIRSDHLKQTEESEKDTNFRYNYIKKMLDERE